MKRLQKRGALKAAINTHPPTHCGNLGFKPVTTRHPPDRLNRRLSAPHTPQLGLRTRPHRASSRGCFLFNIPWKCEAPQISTVRNAPKVNVYVLGNESKNETRKRSVADDSFYRSSGAAHGHRLLRFGLLLTERARPHSRPSSRSPRHKTPVRRAPDHRAPGPPRARVHTSPGARRVQGVGGSGEPSLPPLRR